MPTEPDQTVTFEQQYILFKSLGFGHEKAEEKANMILKNINREKITQTSGKIYPHNNIPNQTTPKKNIPDAKNRVDNNNNKDMGSYHAQGSEKNTVNNIINSTVTTLIKGLAKTKRIINPKKYCEKSLNRMGVRSKAEVERYIQEIMYSIKAKQMQSIQACLWLIEAGKWKAPAGMY
jgi:hypothetical protein